MNVPFCLGKNKGNNISREVEVGQKEKYKTSGGAFFSTNQVQCEHVRKDGYKKHFRSKDGQRSTKNLLLRIEEPFLKKVLN